MRLPPSRISALHFINVLQAEAGEFPKPQRLRREVNRSRQSRGRGTAQRKCSPSVPSSLGEGSKHHFLFLRRWEKCQHGIPMPARSLRGGALKKGRERLRKGRAGKWHMCVSKGGVGDQQIFSPPKIQTETSLTLLSFPFLFS